jgi:hypothetical protein
MKVTKLTQTRPTPFRRRVPRTFWWYWFKKRRPQLNIYQVEGLDINQAQGLTIQSCQKNYQTLQSFYNKYNYVANHIWNFDETCIQARKQLGIKVLAKQGSHQVLTLSKNLRSG